MLLRQALKARRPSIRGPAFAGMSGLIVLAGGNAHAAPQGFLETIHRHTTLTSSVTDNGDLNPYAVVVAPVSAGKIQKDDVLVDNFNNLSNLQGTGTTIVLYRPSTKATILFAKLPQALSGMPGRGRADHIHGHAENRLGNRRLNAVEGRHHGHQGRRVPDRVLAGRQAGARLVWARTSSIRGATWRSRTTATPPPCSSAWPARVSRRPT